MLFQNLVKSLKFNTTGRCMAPLVPTNNRNSWYKHVEGCGVQCQNPLFTDEEHRLVRIFIAIFSALCLVATLFAIVSITTEILFHFCFVFPSLFPVSASHSFTPILLSFSPVFPTPTPPFQTTPPLFPRFQTPFLASFKIVNWRYHPLILIYKHLFVFLIKTTKVIYIFL